MNILQIVKCIFFMALTLDLVACEGNSTNSVHRVEMNGDVGMSEYVETDELGRCGDVENPEGFTKIYRGWKITCVDAENGKWKAEDFVDSRDGKRYKVAFVGEQLWMTQNLNYASEKSWCLDDNPANCELYGRAYESTEDPCPAGWRKSNGMDGLEIAGEEYYDPVSASSTAYPVLMEGYESGKISTVWEGFDGKNTQISRLCGTFNFSLGDCSAVLTLTEDDQVSVTSGNCNIRFYWGSKFGFESPYCPVGMNDGECFSDFGTCVAFVWRGPTGYKLDWYDSEYSPTRPALLESRSVRCVRN